MKVCIDIEANGLINPTKIWVIVCKDIDTGEYDVFRRPSECPSEAERFRRYALRVDHWIGHNLLGYDYLVCHDLLGLEIPNLPAVCTDTLVVSKLVDYPRQGHSVEDYGLEFGLEKGELVGEKRIKFTDFSKYSEEMEEYCKRDVDITHLIYLKYLRYLSNKDHKASILNEQSFQLVVNDISTNGFFFNKDKGIRLLDKVTNDLKVLDKDILDTFIPKLKLIRTVTPRGTKYGTISLSSIPKSLRNNISELTIDAPFSYCHWVEFNPSSHKQIIDVLNNARWSPVDRTQTHIDTEREVNQLKFKKKTSELDKHLKELYSKLDVLRITGWKVNETNLETLPPSAPSSARLLAKRILLESRRRTLTEWLELASSEAGGYRIHGKFYGIGAWTHRMAHQKPNTANIPNDTDTKGKTKLLGKELRSLWCAPKGRLLVGVDAEGIQLRIFAHYINDEEFTKELLNGDPHSLNQSILGNVCRTRDAAKRYIYALLLGAGQGKLREILDCSDASAQEAYRRLLTRYDGYALLKETVIPRDAKRGWFVGLGGRRVRIPGDTDGTRRHLAMSGYLQNGEAVVMKLATLRFLPLLPEGCFLVNLVHDEWQTEVPNDMKTALVVASLQADSLRIVGEELNLRCPLAGSYWNKKRKDYTIDTNWSLTH